MINEIKISDVASYSDKGVIIKPEKINYLFGANGVGKTTISRVINAPQDGNHKNCTVSWSNDQPLDVFVYNRDFIEENFDSQMDGIFTLGVDKKNVREKLEKMDNDKSNFKKELTDLNNTLSTKQEEQNNKKDQFKEVCWKQKVKYGSDFKPALQGSMGSKDDFCERVLKEDSKNNSTDLLSIAKLQKKIKPFLLKMLQK